MVETLQSSQVFKMKILKLVVLALNAFACVKFIAGASGQKTMKFERLLPCPGYKNLTLVVDKINFVRVGKIYAITMKFKLTATTSTQLKIRLQLVRCKTKEALDTCESIPDMVFSTLCMILTLKLPPFGSAINAIEPQMKCPIQKGTYTMTNYTIDEASLAVLPLEGWYWKMHTSMYDKIDGVEKLISCMYMECSMVYI